jgi:hypothetical protein
MNPIRLSSQSALKHCQHRGSAGRRCRMPVSDPASGFCFHHAAQQKKQDDAADLSAALTGNSEEFRSVEGINQSLGELYKLLAQNRISPRRAAVLAYISNLLLRTVTAMENLHEEEPMRLNFDGMTSPISEVEQARPEFAS